MGDLIYDLCKNKEFSNKIGVICGLTMDKPNVKYSCNLYDEDDLLKGRFARDENHRNEADSRVDRPNFGMLSDILIESL
jgi:hypothetical protein